MQSDCWITGFESRLRRYAQGSKRKIRFGTCLRVIELAIGYSVRGVLQAVVCFLALSTDLLSPIHQDLGNLGPRLMIL